MKEITLLTDKIFLGLLLFVALAVFGLIMTLTLYFLKKKSFINPRRRPARNTSRAYTTPAYTNSGDIRDYGVNEILSSGRFTAAERKAEYRRRGKSPSGVIDGVYNDMYRGNESYNDSYRDWEADA